MENLIILLFDISLFSIYIVFGFIFAIIIQLISYRIFKFNLYKFLKHILFKECE